MATPIKVTEYTDQVVKWTDWSGTSKHLRPTARCMLVASLVVRGSFATIDLGRGQLIRKKLSSIVFFGFAENGFDREGFDRAGFDVNGLDRNGRSAFDPQTGWNIDGLHASTGRKRDRDGFDQSGFDSRGFSRQRLHRLTGTNRNTAGRDADGYDVEGYKDGRDREGRDKLGRDPDGYDYQGVNAAGLDRATVAEQAQARARAQEHQEKIANFERMMLARGKQALPLARAIVATPIGEPIAAEFQRKITNLGVRGGTTYSPSNYSRRFAAYVIERQG